MQDNLLAQKIAQQFIAGKVDGLDTFTSIDDAAAESLSKHQGGLGLDGEAKAQVAKFKEKA